MSVKNMTKKERLKARKLAYKKWFLAKTGKTTPVNLEIIAKDCGFTFEELQYYMVKDKWELRLEKDKKNKVLQKQIKEELKGITYDGPKEDLEKIDEILDNSNLTERHKLFIMYYLQSFNIKHSAIRAGYAVSSAHTRGSELLADDRIKKVLRDIKSVMHKSIYITTHDIIDEYIRIAFADMTDFVEFDENKVNLKDSTKVDGRLIQEVKQGRDGVTIKLADKMKALEKLEKLFDVIPDKRLLLEHEKFEFTKKMAEKEDGNVGSKVVIINDLMTDGD